MLICVIHVVKCVVSLVSLFIFLSQNTFKKINKPLGVWGNYKSIPYGFNSSFKPLKVFTYAKLTSVTDFH